MEPRPFLIGRTDYESNVAARVPGSMPIDCCHCGSGSVFPEPPYPPRRPTVWRCADCRGQFSVHRA